MQRLFFASITALGLLAGCATSQNAVVAGIESGYIAAESAELVYIQSGKADPAIVKQAETYRIAAANAIKPVLSAAASGGSAATAAEVEAAQAALAALTGYLAANDITTTQGA